MNYKNHNFCLYFTPILCKCIKIVNLSIANANGRLAVSHSASISAVNLIFIQLATLKLFMRFFMEWRELRAQTNKRKIIFLWSPYNVHSTIHLLYWKFFKNKEINAKIFNKRERLKDCEAKHNFSYLYFFIFVKYV